MPDTTRSGRASRTLSIAMFTQSVGVPSTANTRWPTSSSRSGRRSVSACPTALASDWGATTVTSPKSSSAARERLEARRKIPVVIGDQNAAHQARDSIRSFVT